MQTKPNSHLYEERKAAILEAAIEVFAKIGYHKVTTADISGKAGISQPYVYRFFESKEALFLEVVQLIYDRIAGEFAKVECKNDTLLADLITSYEDLMRRYPNEILLQIQTWGIAEENVQKLVKASLEDLKELVQRKFEKAGLPDVENLAKDFLARGFLCNLSFALGSPALSYGRKV
ncbi:TetR/AcrR family transcriptional regulator [Leptospira sp. 'Mane']|uniref:TetR/AcrR family transcriptional regulator n=1 Tax=Leptospira sp. 'Mane' TaxID=3387407 RepID=UPI00398AD4A3